MQNLVVVLQITVSFFDIFLLWWPYSLETTLGKHLRGAAREHPTCITYGRNIRRSSSMSLEGGPSCFSWSGFAYGYRIVGQHRALKLPTGEQWEGGLISKAIYVSFL